MGKAEQIIDGVYLVGGPNISLSEDATVFVIDFSGELVMIDTGAGRSARTPAWAGPVGSPGSGKGRTPAFRRRLRPAV